MSHPVLAVVMRPGFNDIETFERGLDAVCRQVGMPQRVMCAEVSGVPSIACMMTNAWAKKHSVPFRLCMDLYESPTDPMHQHLRLHGPDRFISAEDQLISQATHICAFTTTKNKHTCKILVTATQANIPITWIY